MTTPPEALRPSRPAEGPPSAHVSPLAEQSAAGALSVGVPPVVFTIGHSTRTLQEFIELLKAHRIKRLVDVRTVPRSRHNPQFNRQTLHHALEAAGIAYAHVAGLGGFRRSTAKSPNGAWRNASFRGYADYMQTDEFAENLASVVEQSASQRIALMCAEAVPWRCHRSLIADALVVRGVRVKEIVNATRTRVHGLTSFARVDGAAITYPPQESAQAGDRLRSGESV